MSNGAIELAEFATLEWYHVMMDINAQRQMAAHASNMIGSKKIRTNPRCNIHLVINL